MCCAIAVSRTPHTPHHTHTTPHHTHHTTHTLDGRGRACPWTWHRGRMSELARIHTHTYTHLHTCAHVYTYTHTYTIVHIYTHTPHSTNTHTHYSYALVAVICFRLSHSQPHPTTALMSHASQSKDNRRHPAWRRVKAFGASTLSEEGMLFRVSAAVSRQNACVACIYCTSRPSLVRLACVC